MSTEIPPLAIEDFEEFFVELRRPERGVFPWQRELVADVATRRRWPDLVNLPTGSGKTSLIDIAVFLMALDGGVPPAERWMPRRLAWVVDRRVVVDQAERQASSARRALESAQSGVASRVAQRLRRLSGDGPALLTTALRGGIVRDETWATRPDVPAVVSSTVDQVGSRLLFRGYGLSAGMQPIHAGLLAHDTLFVLDEVHLAQPFAQTLAAVKGFRTAGGAAGQDVPDRWHVVQLSATPSGAMSGGWQFPGRPLDPGSHPVLDRRLRAPKPVRLERVKVTRDGPKADEAFAAACARHADALLGGAVQTIGVVVNRVDTARRIADGLRPRADLDVHLVTGRMRPLDRDRLLADIEPRVRTGRQRGPDDRPLVVVATQSIEAGADFDFDALVTECASLDALRQRFGRVDRDGRVSAGGSPAESVVLVRSTADGVPDPVYGTALSETWRWLSDLASVDFGLTALDLRSADLSKLVPDGSKAPVLLPGHLDQWVQRRQSGRAEPDVERWLHGMDVDEELADVELVWRADLHPSLFDPGAADLLSRDLDTLHQGIIDRVAACPPTSAETLGVPFVHFRRWAARRGGARGVADVALADAPAVSAEEVDSSIQVGDVLYLRWRGGQGAMVTAEQIRPGDTVVLPAAAGGISHDNWDPSSREPVADIAAEAVAAARRLAVVRLKRLGAPDDAGLSTLDPSELEAAERNDQIEAVKDAVRSATLRSQLSAHQEVADHLLKQTAKDLVFRAFPEAVSDGEVVESYVVWSKVRMSVRSVGAGEPAQPSAAVATDDEDDTPSFTGAASAVELDAHLDGVGGLARAFAVRLGLSDRVVSDLELAGRLHDAGKVDPRFQLWLHDANEVAHAAAAMLLAKSAVPDTDRRRRTVARRKSRYPHRARHEMLSLALVEAAPGLLDQADDPDLVRYLVASHHGWARYRFDPISSRDPDDEAPSVELDLKGGTVLRADADYRLARLDRGVPDMFWRLVRRYGWFTLAWFEAILRLADHEQSRREVDASERDEPADVTESEAIA